MKRLVPFLIFSGLALFGFFYHISSSEFWPITVSKMWWNGTISEGAQIQKPLFTLFLSLFHLLPLNDIYHIYLVKLTFVFLGLATLYFYAQSVYLYTHKKRASFFLVSILIFLFLLLSPVSLKNFFRIRSDQVGLLLFILSIYFNLIKKWRLSILCAVLLPLSSIKAVLFFIPLCLIFIPSYVVHFQKLHFIKKLNITLLSSAALIWIIAHNLPALSYLIATHKELSFPTLYLKEFIFLEWIFVILSAGIAVLWLIQKKKDHWNLGLAALSALILILITPQSYPYYIASLIPIVYAPVFIVFIRLYVERKKILFTLLGAQAINAVVISVFLYSFTFYLSNKPQINFISAASQLIEKHSFNYLDGVGLLPRQNLTHCFVSPSDPIANNSCRQQIESSPDVIIITQRLNSLGFEVFEWTGKYYFQVYPNLWVHQKYQHLIPETERELFKLPLPIIIFSTD